MRTIRFEPYTREELEAAVSEGREPYYRSLRDIYTALYYEARLREAEERLSHYQGWYDNESANGDMDEAGG